ncbi:MAG: nitrile hydratase [Mycolicibacterium sp.]|uniref:nitrile hydratase n=1 Tax=Mycolicibacterium sp. TaxID=2320850 RepID=UPI003D0CD879
MPADLETALTARAWRDPDFADLLRRDPAAALAQVGVRLPAGVRVDVRIQDPNTLYYLIPPATDPANRSTLGVIDQIDLWRSGDTFCWVMPEQLKLALLDMRRQYRSQHSTAGQTTADR